MNKATGLDSACMGTPVLVDIFVDICLFVHQGAEECAKLLLAKLQNRIQSNQARQSLVNRYQILTFTLV